MIMILKIVENYILEAENDYVGLWQITQCLRIRYGIKSDSDVKKKSLLVTRGLIENGVYPGYMTKDNGFDFWKGTLDELLAQIAASWPTIGIPNLATDHCWFAERSGFDAEGNNLVYRPSLGGKIGA